MSTLLLHQISSYCRLKHHFSLVSNFHLQLWSSSLFKSTTNIEDVFSDVIAGHSSLFTLSSPSSVHRKWIESDVWISLVVFWHWKVYLVMHWLLWSVLVCCGCLVNAWKWDDWPFCERCLAVLQDSYVSIWLKKGLSLHFSLWGVLHHGLCCCVIWCYIWHHDNSGISVCAGYLCSSQCSLRYLFRFVGDPV